MVEHAASLTRNMSVSVHTGGQEKTAIHLRKSRATANRARMEELAPRFMIILELVQTDMYANA
jgi:hypothetical protein